MTNATEQAKPTVKYLITDHTITCNVDGKTYMLARTDAQASALIDALKSGDHSKVPELVSVAHLIEKYTEGTFKVVDGEVMVDGEPVHGLLAAKIKEFHSQGLPYNSLVNFARNVRKNPNERARNDLFAFIQRNEHPITSDGHFIAYKKIRKSKTGNFVDIHSGTVEYIIGEVASMPRAEVDDNAERTCSRGLHASSFNYAKNHFGNDDDPLIEVSINPKNICAVPVDYNQEKLRCCEMMVLRIVDKPSIEIFRNI